MIENRPSIEECEVLAEQMLENMEYNDLVESFIYHKSKELYVDYAQYFELKKFYEVEE